MDRAALAEEVTHLLNGRTYLTLADLLQLLRRNVTLPVDLTHLGTLWMLDRCGQSCRWREAAGIR